MPARFRDIKRAAAKNGIDCEKPKSGSHWKFRTVDQCYPISAHNRMKTEIPDNYIKGLCRAFGLNYKSFKASL